MNKLKTQLLMLGRDRGDTGEPEQQRAMIAAYVETLEVYLTPEGIETFTLDQLRAGYIEFVKLYATGIDQHELVKRFALCIHLRDSPRTTHAEATPSSTTVVDIFSRKA